MPPATPRRPMKLSVVILNWNAAEDTAACVRSVRAWESHGGPSRPAIWVVDNGSDPPGIDPIRREFPEVHALESPVNRGFAGGCNLGIRAALDHGSEAVLLLNNDASVDASSVAALLATLESDPVDRGRRTDPLAPGAVHLRRWAERRAVCEHPSPAARAAGRPAGRGLRPRDGGPHSTGGVRPRGSSGRGLLLLGRDGGPVPARAGARVPVGDRASRPRPAQPGSLGPGAANPAHLLHRPQPVPLRPEASPAAMGGALRAVGRASRPHGAGGRGAGPPAAGRGRGARRPRRPSGTLRRAARPGPCATDPARGPS